jgi:hypothetical protein
MTARPDAGYQFAGWTKVNEFETVTYELDNDGSILAVTSIVITPISEVINRPQLNFAVSPPQLIYNAPTLRVTEISGWQANFVRKTRPGFSH